MALILGQKHLNETVHMDSWLNCSRHRDIEAEVIYPCTYFLCHSIYCPLYRRKKEYIERGLLLKIRNMKFDWAANVGEVRAEDVRVCWMGDQPDWLSSPCAIFFVYEGAWQA
jgi:hypothetical protein